MTTTVRQWTGLEAKALRAALRMTIHDFAAYLGVGTRTVSKWESRGSDIEPKPQAQSILDTALAMTSGDVQARFAAVVGDSLTSETRTVDAAPDAGRRGGDADTPTSSSPSAAQSGVLLPVVVDGRQILLPLDAATIPGRGLASAMNLAPSPGDPSRLEAKPADVERAYELYLRGQDTARDAADADPDDVTVWNLLGYLHRLGGDEAAAHDAWSRGLEHVAASAGEGDCHNPRVQSWLANIEACVGHAERAHSRVARLTEAEPHNGYLKYRLTHVLAELGDAEAAIRTLREAIQDGFLSVQLLWHDERLGLSNLVDLAEYHQVRRALRRNVERVKNRYAPRA